MLDLVVILVLTHSAFADVGFEIDQPIGSATAPLTLLPRDATTAHACLDGSPYGYYFVPSSTNSTKWTISIQGGGWCYDEDDCASRGKTHLGSSKLFPASAGCGCMNVDADADPDQADPRDATCNCVFLPYCDGASFSGFRTDPWPVPSAPNETLMFRGIKNFDETFAAALELGLKDATELVVTGGSAGGLSTFLHMDRAAAALRVATGHDNTPVRGAPVVGFFLDHDNYVHDENNYTARMKYIYGMQNLTFGADGGLTAACEKVYPDDPHYCPSKSFMSDSKPSSSSRAHAAGFMSPHMQSVVQTPFYVFNSRFDSWQLANELQTKWDTADEQARRCACHGACTPRDPTVRSFHASCQQAAVLRYGDDFNKQFEPVMAPEKAHGAFITTCQRTKRVHRRSSHSCAFCALSEASAVRLRRHLSWLLVVVAAARRQDCIPALRRLVRQSYFRTMACASDVCMQ